MRNERWYKEIDIVNKYIDEMKAKGYKSVINPKQAIKDGNYIPNRLFEVVYKERNDLDLINDNQYQIIYNESNKDSNPDFEIEHNKPFYEKKESFKKKNLLVKFLDTSKKVYVNKDMFFVPYRYKRDDKFYLLVVNNILENIEAYQLKSLNFLNKQHNIYYIIETNRDDKFKEINEFKNHIIKTCQEYTNYNHEVLYKVYDKIDNFKKEKAISRQYS